MQRLPQGVAGGVALYCGYKAMELLFEFPEPCQMMMQRALDDSQVREVLGAPPLRRSLLWSGTVTGERASVRIPVWGDRGGAHLVGRAVRSKQGDETLWHVLTLELEGATLDKPLHVLPDKGVAQPTPAAVAAFSGLHGAAAGGQPATGGRETATRDEASGPNAGG